MKVILINGSPHKDGCTFTALNEVAKSLEQNEIKTEIIHRIRKHSWLHCLSPLLQNKSMRVSRLCKRDS